MDEHSTSFQTTFGDGSKAILYDNIEKISDLHRVGFSDSEKRNRILKYTLVTATEKGYEMLEQEIFDSLETDKMGEMVFNNTVPFGDLLEKRKKKKKFIENIRKINPELCERLKDIADSYIRTIIGMIGEYESYVKGKTQEKKSRDLKAHYANSRYGYKNSLKLEKEELLRVELLKLEKIYTDLGKKYNISANSTLEQQKQKAKWNYGFLIKNLEYVLSDGILIGRHKFCQIPIEDKPDSEVSGLQGIIGFDEDNPLNKERKIRYNNLGFNLGNIIRLKGKDKESLETHFDEETDCVIDLDDKSHQLSIVLFGKAIPIVENGGSDKKFIQALISKAIKKSQYYLALELPASSF